MMKVKCATCPAAFELSRSLDDDLAKAIEHYGEDVFAKRGILIVCDPCNERQMAVPLDPAAWLAQLGQSED